MQGIYRGEYYSCKDAEKVPYLDQLVVWNRKQNEVIIFLVNRSEDESLEADIVLEGMAPNTVKEAVFLAADDKKKTNREDHSAVIPKKNEDVKVKDNHVIAELLPLSFHMLRISL